MLEIGLSPPLQNLKPFMSCGIVGSLICHILESLVAGPMLIKTKVSQNLGLMSPSLWVILMAPKDLGQPIKKKTPQIVIIFHQLTIKVVSKILKPKFLTFNLIHLIQIRLNMTNKKSMESPPQIITSLVEIDQERKIL